MKKLILIFFIGLLFTACKQQTETITSDEIITSDTVAVIAEDTTRTELPARPAGKLAAKAINDVEGKNGEIISFTYDNNASTVSFELNGKQVVLTSKEKVSDIPNANGRTYGNDELTYNNKDGIKITDKTGKIIFEENNK